MLKGRRRFLRQAGLAAAAWLAVGPGGIRLAAAAATSRLKTLNGLPKPRPDLLDENSAKVNNA